MRSLFLGLNLLAVIASVAANGVFSDGEEGDGAYGFSFEAKYPNGVALACSSEEVMIINSIVHGGATLDSIAAMIAPSIPDFELAFAMGSPDLLLDFTGDVAEVPTAEENMEHMTTADKLTDLQFEQSMEDEVAAEANSPDRRLKRRERQTALRSTLVPAPTEMTPFLGFGALADVTEESLKVNEEHRVLRRKKKTVAKDKCPSFRDCPDKKRGLGSTFYCMCFCGYRYNRRRLVETQPDEGPDDTAPPTPPLEPTVTDPPTEVVEAEEATDAPTEAPTVSPESEFQDAVDASNERISKDLLIKMSYLARHNICPCLGNHWELEVKYTAAPEFTDRR